MVSQLFATYHLFSFQERKTKREGALEQSSNTPFRAYKKMRLQCSLANLFVAVLSPVSQLLFNTK